MNITVSVIVPVYNAENTIVECLESIRHQTYPYIKAVIIDDGSLDNSSNIIREYIEKNNLNHWIFVSRENRGVSATRNQAVKLSNDDYIAFLDADDLWKKDKVEKQIKFIEDFGAEIVGCNFHNKNAKSAFEIYHLKEMLYHNYLYTSTVLMKKDLFMEFEGFNEQMRYSEDYNLWLKIATIKPIYVMNNVLVVYDFKNESNGASKNLKAMEKGELSNYHFLYKTQHISRNWYYRASIFSYLKYLARLIRK